MQLEKNNLIDDLYRWQKAYSNNIKALGYSSNTLQLYSRAIDMFMEYMLDYQDDIRLSDIKAIQITGYLAYLEEEARKRGVTPKNNMYLSKSTKQAYLKAIKQFFVFISDNNDQLFNFERYFKNIKIADSSTAAEKIVFLDDREIGNLLNVLERAKSRSGNYNSYRNALLIKLMLYGGLRISEALGVTLNSFTATNDEDLYAIKIYAKGGKEQTAYIAKKNIDDELEYFHKASNMHKDEHIMRTTGGKQLNRINAYQAASVLYKKAGIKKEGLHLLRHTLAMRLTQKGVSLVVIKKILRHSSIATTTIYSKSTEAQVAEVMREGA